EVTSVEGGVGAPVMPVADIPLLGAHNVSNVLAAVALGRAAGIPAASVAGAVRGFRAVAHRLEPVLESDGVLWINDSKATNGDAVLLSPGYTSFDQFSGFEERGREFARLVRELCAAAPGRC